MEITIKLDDKTDVSFFKKMLLQLKGVKSVEVSDEGKTYSWDEIESSEDFKMNNDLFRERLEAVN